MLQINGTKFDFAANQAMDKDGRIHLLAVLKGTYQIPASVSEPPQIAEHQVPIHDADVFAGQPGQSAPLFESDWSLFKRKCDVILLANASSPHGQPVKELTVGFEVGECRKRARVVGHRQWEKLNNGSLQPGEPEPFSSQPITYESSFGGCWDRREQGYEFYAANPVGTGFARKFQSELEGRNAPSIESPNHPVSQPDVENVPWSFGPLGRNWSPRVQLAGTYDDEWLEKKFPLLPDDFDTEYFQCVPADQQVDYLHGGERVVLHHLHSQRPRLEFNLPKDLQMPLIALTQNQEQLELNPVVDTLTIDVPNNRFSLVWRASVAIQRSVKEEIKMIAAGYVCKKWWLSQLYGTEDCTCDGQEDDPEKLISINEAMTSDA